MWNRPAPPWLTVLAVSTLIVFFALRAETTYEAAGFILGGATVIAIYLGWYFFVRQPKDREGK